jgi:hypothetical protein
MLSLQSKSKLCVVLAFCGVFAAMMLYGCQSGQNPSTMPNGAGPATQSSEFALWGPAPKKSGVELWSDNCARCHNIRPPDEFSAAQWDVIVHEMRLRANLTGEEQREIVKFLQASR